MKRIKSSIISMITAFAMVVTGFAVMPAAIPEGYVHADTSYTLNGGLVEGQTGVYKVKAAPGADMATATIGIPSVSKDKLTDVPTTEAPAIIMGAASDAAGPFETKTGPTSFDVHKERTAPYSYFRYQIIDEQMKDADGKITTHKKMSGFDGSYYIIRIDVSELLDGVTDLDSKYLHVKEEDNKALMVAVGMEETKDGDTFVKAKYTGMDTSGKVTKTASFSLANAAAAMKDGGDASGAPYYDVILLSSGKLTAGADAGKEGQPEGDVKLSFYIDNVADYHPGLVALDPNNMPTFPYKCKPDGESGPEVEYKTESDYNNALLTKYFESETQPSEPATGGEGTEPATGGEGTEPATGGEGTEPATGGEGTEPATGGEGTEPAAETKAPHENATSYLVKGSDLEIDVTVDDNEVTGDTPEFWSLTKAMAHQKYDSHTIKLICEVPVLDALRIQGTEKRNVILDVNSFDIQIANNTTQNQAGLTIDNNATLTIKDGTNTSGAELAIGNNATMVIKKGGVLEIDESCTNEVEYDAATTPAGETPPDPATLAIGEITVEDGGQLVNRGVINIEGAEAKPIDPSQADTAVQTDMKRADMFVNFGGTLDNYGCLSLKGDLYVLGTLNNYGKYTDIINAHDPDKGTTAYHRGIQVTWKDVVNDPKRKVEPGKLWIGMDAEGNVSFKNRGVLNNKGDVVLVPGILNLYGVFNNEGNLYLCTATEAIIPVINPNDPLEVEKRVTLNPPRESEFNTQYGTVNNKGKIGKATVELIHNGVLGKLTPIEDSVPTPTPAPAVQDGQTAVVNGSTYKVTSASAKTAEYVKAPNKKSVSVPATVNINGVTLAVTSIGPKAFTGKKIKTVTVGANVSKIAKNAFKGSKATKMIVKTKKLTKKSVKGSLKGSKIKTVKVKVGKKAVNKKYVKKYKKFFTKKNAGKKAKVKR